MPPREMLVTPLESEVTDIVRETLIGVSPRAATLALLRFPEYLDLIQKSGVETTDALCTALFAELRAICAADR